MDQLQRDGIIQMIPAPNSTIIKFRPPPPDPRSNSNRLQPNASQRPEVELKNSAAARKVQKADREKLRRDRLNEQFIELGHTLDPDRPKNEKGTILADTIHLLKDLTDQVNRLKAEYTTLTEESRELTQEKNDLREEKASLKSDIENLNVQYQQRLRSMYPWAGMDQSVVMTPPSYPFPLAVPMPPAPIPMHPSMQPYPFFGNQNPGIIPNPCSTFVPYVTPNTIVEQQPAQYMHPPQPVSRSRVSGKHDSKSKSSGESKIEKSVDSDNVTTDLELKTPGSTAYQDLSSLQRKKKPRSKESSNQESSSSRCSSSPSVHDCSSTNTVDATKGDAEKDER